MNNTNHALSTRSTTVTPGELNPELLLTLFGQKPIVFHRVYIDVTGSATAAIWLASALSAIEDMRISPSDWWGKTQKEWEELTGLSRREQDSARLRLRHLGVLEERYDSQGRRQYRIVGELLYQLIHEHTQNKASNKQG